MSQIKKIMIAGLLIVFISGSLIIGGCGNSTPNSKALFNSDSGTHPSAWIPDGHAAAAAPDGNACTECHGSDLSGGISGVSCISCHVNGSPFILTGCTSCHETPPSGTVAPNRAGAHTAHNVLPNVTNICDTCHQGAGSGTMKHDNGTVDVAFLSIYNAKSGTAVHNADGTCSKVSCHGGQTTPVWLSGTKIDVNTQCELCHAFGTFEYNSYVSGQHDDHVDIEGIPCISCHDSAKLSQNHFTSLNTTSMEGPASATIGGLVTDYTGGTCTTLCHVPRSWF